MSDTGDTRSLTLRILYTINSSPQYILARSHKKVTVSLVRRQPRLGFHYASTLPLQEITTSIPVEEPQGLYATASLKTCLDAICCSSPELVQDHSRDFSVYVLDPLESQSTPAPVNISSQSSSTDPSASCEQNSQASNQQPRGVAVGLGLMSWALLADEQESVPVTGTVLNSGTMQEALEVIFALRETAPMQKSSLPTTLRSWGLPPPPTKRSQVHASKGHHSSSRSNKSSSALASSNIPRHSSNHSENNHAPSYATSRDTNVVYFKKHHKPSSEALPYSDPTPSDSILQSSTVYIGPPKRKVGRPSDGVGKNKSKKTSLASSRSSMDENSLGSLLHQSLRQTANPQASTAIDPSLMQTLATLSSSGENAALLAALSAIDSGSSPEVPNTEAPNPALVDALKQLLSVVCSAANANSQATPPQPPSKRPSKYPVDDDVVILDKENVDPTAFRRKVDKDGGKSSSSTPHAPDTSRPRLLGNMENSSQSTNTPAVVRKRRLSDFMDEMEREHSNRSKGRNRGNHPGKRIARSESASSVQKLPSSSHYRDMWGRPLTSPPRPTPSRENSAKSVNPPVPAASSPVRPLRSYSVPEWARTTTATQPRFSKEVEEQRQAMEAEAKRKKDAAKKDRKTARRRGNDRALDTAAGRVLSKELSRVGAGTRPSVSLSALREPPKPITASSSLHFPIIASDLSLPPSSPPPSTSPTSIGMEPPQTPPRQDRLRSPSMTQNPSSSLFTPTPDFRMSERSSRFNGPTINESPFSPTTGVAYARKTSQNHTMGERDKLEENSASSDTEDFLSRELDCDLEDLDITLNSLPIASSDADDEPFQDYSEEELAFHQESETQHWAGLPPSSPPPPTSPSLTPQDLSSSSSDRDDNADLFTPYSECLLGSNEHLFPDSQHDPISFDDFSNLFGLGGDAQFGEGDFAAFCEKSPVDGTGYLECGSSPSTGLGDLSAEQNCFTDIDFAEFWQSVRPLVGQQVEGSSEMPEVGMQGELVAMEEIDHSKLAAAVQALFSGCLT